MGQIVIVDTSVFLNILDVPGRNQNRAATFRAFTIHVNAGDHLYLPVPCIIETGNHISRLRDGHDRYQCAKRFVAEVRNALNGSSPWQPVPLLPEGKDDWSGTSGVERWLVDFPNEAQRQVSLTDVTVKDLFTQFCDKFPMSTVRVWALDGHLASLQRLHP